MKWLVCTCLVAAMTARCDIESFLAELGLGPGRPAGMEGGINAGDPDGRVVPEFGEPVSVRVISESQVDARVIVRYRIGAIEVRREERSVPALTTLPDMGPDLAAFVQITGEYAFGQPTPGLNALLGEDFVADDVIIYIIPNDECPNDPDKLEMGQCGCGVPDTDTDGDGVADCIDLCPDDPQKIDPGVCGCGELDTDTDNDGTLDCLDGCPLDPQKTSPGICGCGQADIDSDGDGTPNCIDGCPSDPAKTSPGLCGCGVEDSDLDSDLDGVIDCRDECPDTPPDVRVNAVGCEVEACCLFEGDQSTCAMLTPDECEARQGARQGRGSDCSSAACPELEACCLPGGESMLCEMLLYESCLERQGIPQGAGSRCETATCTFGSEVEACCLNNGEVDYCEMLSYDDCLELEGSPQGVGTTCATTVCGSPSATEACCVDCKIDGPATDLGARCCIDVAPDLCLSEYGGDPLGPKTSCYPGICDEQMTACCLPDDQGCVDVSVAECYERQGEPEGAGTACSPNSCAPQN